jgi:Family of unknown function (DUF5906)
MSHTLTISNGVTFSSPANARASADHLERKLPLYPEGFHDKTKWSDADRNAHHAQQEVQRQKEQARADVDREKARSERRWKSISDTGSRGSGRRNGIGVLVRGVEKSLTTLGDLNDRFALLEAPGSASVYVSRADFLPIQDQDLKRRLAGEVVHTRTVDDKPAYETAFNFWTGHAQRHVYRRVAFTNKPLGADVYNLYRGLGVTPREGKCERVLAHVREVICSGNTADAEAMLKLLAWQVQNIGEPSRIITILKSAKQQAGKGILLGELMLKIYGPSGFSASTTDQVLGRFNDAIRGRAFVFMDEVLFAGDRRSADALKSLSTSTAHGIETKGLPVIQCPVGVNLWLASNHENAAFIEEHDARYWALDISEHRVGDTAYFAELMREIDNGGREAFAHYLINLDVRDFVPSRDVPKDNAAKREMIKRSINPYDARKWLEECCHTERILGKRDAEGADWLWTEGDEHSFASLRNAYVAWQTTVRSRVAAEPTHPSSLGQVLSDAGFGSRRTNAGPMRHLPALKSCLDALYKFLEPQDK